MLVVMGSGVHGATRLAMCAGKFRGGPNSAPARRTMEVEIDRSRSFLMRVCSGRDRYEDARARIVANAKRELGLDRGSVEIDV